MKSETEVLSRSYYLLEKDFYAQTNPKEAVRDRQRDPAALIKFDSWNTSHPFKSI